MAGFLDRLLNIKKKGGTAASLRDRLRTYPPYEAPAPGPAHALSAAQAHANLAYLLAHRAQRIDALAWLLQAETGIDLLALLDAPAGPRVHDITLSLFKWGKERWPALPKPRPRCPSAWEITQRHQGDGLVFAMLMDVAIVLGECVVRSSPDWRWDVDLIPCHITRELTTARRVVLMADPVGQAPEPYIVDIESAVVTFFAESGDEALTTLNRWDRIVQEAISGAHQAWDRQQAGG